MADIFYKELAEGPRGCLKVRPQGHWVGKVEVEIKGRKKIKENKKGVGLWQ